MDACLRGMQVYYTILESPLGAYGLASIAGIFRAWFDFVKHLCY